jgi:glycosyltransferase involved in cell wall biosynthesis
MATPKISAIICTHNRDSYVGVAIDSLLTQDFAGEFEVIVVDNASSDRTRAVVESRLSDPRLHYVYEPQLGLSVARNTGANTAQSPILAYLDDDAIASPQWLAALYQAYERHDRLAIAGGRVTLLWPPHTHPPAWLSQNLTGSLGAYDLGDQIIYINQPGMTPRGVNYSIQKAFLDNMGGFNPHLGRVGTNLLSNEELYMTELALMQGWQVAYLPDALVAHQVAPERLTPAWFLSRSWWQGISECYREQLADRVGAEQLLRGGERLLRGLYLSVKYSHHPAQRFDHFVYAYGQIGYLKAVIQSQFLPSGWLKLLKQD